MAVETAASFLDVLQKSKLLKNEQLDIARQLAEGVSDARALARALIQKELLSRWQAAQLLAGRTAFLWGKYRLVDLLGRGGMGSVFLAWHTIMNRAVALKIISKELGKDAAALERFFTEARAVAALDHPNIVHAYDVANEGDRYYLVMEYVEGRDLQRIVEEKGPLDFALAVDYMRQAAEGLAHAHSRDMIHCDIKPANLLVSQQGVVKILDMGMARAVGVKARAADGSAPEDQAILGSVDYMAPEQAEGIDKLDRRSDIYSLGCTFYFTLTGRPPFPEGTLAERILKHQKEDPRDIAEYRPNTPPELVHLCRKMMAKDPNDRFQTADEVAKALSEWRPVPTKILRATPLEEAEAEAELVDDETPADAPPSGGKRTPAISKAKASLVSQLVTRAEGWLDYVRADRRRMMIWGGAAGAVVVLMVFGLLVSIVLSVRSARRQDRAASQAAAAASKVEKRKSVDNDFAELESELEKKWAAEKEGKDSGEAKTPVPGPPPKPGGPPPKPGVPPPPPGKTATPAAPPTRPEAAEPKSASSPPKPEPKPEPAPPAEKDIKTPASAPGAEKVAPPAAKKASEEKKTPASQKKDEAPAPKPASKPAPPADAFAGFPAYVELPPLPDADAGEFAPGPTLLGAVHGPVDNPVFVDLVGEETAVRGKRHFAFEPRDNGQQRGWVVRLESSGKEDAPVEVAQFFRDGDGLKFRWAEKVSEIAATADYLRNCALELRGGGPPHMVALRKPELVEPVVLDLNKGVSTVNVPIEFMPDPANLRIEFIKVTGPGGPLAMDRLEKPVFQPATPIAPKTTATLHFPRRALRGHQLPGVEFGIKTLVKGKGLSMTVSLSSPGPQQFKGLLAQMNVPAVRNEVEQKVRGLPNQFAAAKEEAQKAKIAEDFDNRSLPLWYEEFYRLAHRNARLHFRVFIDAKEHQIDLVRTEAPN